MKLTTDVLQHICETVDRKSLLCISLANKEFRNASAPFVFRNVKIEGTWESTEPRVDFVLNHLPEACGMVRSFRFSVFVWDGFEDAAPDRMDPIPEFPSRLCTLLSKMTMMNDFDFNIPETSSALFLKAFVDHHSLSLPSVTKLVLSPFTEFLVYHCPLVTDVSTCTFGWLRTTGGQISREHSVLLIHAIKGRPLRKFGMFEWWTTSLTKAILGVMPSIPELDMNGGRYEDNLHAHLPLLAQFTNLKRLHLSSASDLGVGFNPPWCGNAYDVPGVREEVDRDEKIATERVIQDVATACQHLEELWLSTYTHVLIQRSKNGEITYVDA